MSVVSRLKNALVAASDLAAVLAVTGVTDYLVFTDVRLPLVRLLLVLSLVFLLPGYAVMAAIRPDTASPGVAERLLLSVGTSVGVATAVGFTLHYSGIGVGAAPAFVALSAVVLCGCVVAFLRRLRVPPARRFDGADLVGPVRAAGGLVSVRTRADVLITVVLVSSLVVAAGGVASVAMSADERATYTEFGLLTETENGTLVAADYPADPDESLVVEVANHEGESVAYTVVVQVERPLDDEARPSRLARFRNDVAHGETWRTRVAVPDRVRSSPTRQRMVFLLYEGPAPETPRRETAYRSVHVWLNASSPSSRIGPPAPG